MIVVAGEALIDLLPIPGPHHHFDARPGGAPCNVAVGLARLARETCFLGRISADSFGQLLRRHLEDAGVDLSMAAQATEPTTLGVVAVDGHGKAEYSFYANGTADWQWKDSELPESLPASARALYVGGLGLRLAPGAANLEGLMVRTRRQGSALIFLDPNIRSGLGFQSAAERARVERQIQMAHVVKASIDDIALLYPGRDYREVAAEWRRITSGMVVVTLGPEGAYALAPDGAELIFPAFPADVIDTVGAGDAFSSALLDGLVGEVPRDAAPAAGLHRLGIGVTRLLLERASASAAFTCGRVGAESADPQTLDNVVRRTQDQRAGPAKPVHLYGQVTPQTDLWDL
jgi:fructokinase